MNTKEKVLEKLKENNVDPKDLKNILDKCKESLEDFNGMLGFYRNIRRLEMLLGEQEEETKKAFSLADALDEFFFGVAEDEDEYREHASLACSFGSLSVALLVFKDYFIENPNFTIIDLEHTEAFKKIVEPEIRTSALAFIKPESSKMAVEMDDEIYSVPTSNFVAFKDNNEVKYIFTYKPSAMGGVDFQLLSENDLSVTQMLKQLRKDVIRSKYLLGKTIELNDDGINIVAIKEHEIPTLDAELESRLNREILSVYNKTEEFNKHNLALRRSVILAGPPGTGKTSYCRYLAHKLKGRVTTLWVTAKSINRAQDVARVFETARMLSPVLLVMEDLDLIAGTRNSLASQYHGNSSNPLGEMLNQLDGLTRNDSLVLVGTTNEIKALDSALSDRPGRFDRIFSVGVPSNEMSLKIAEDFLVKHNVDTEVIKDLNLTCIVGNDYSGAQIIEVLKGALLDSINSGVALNNFMLNRSVKDLNDQRDMILGKDRAKKPENLK